LAMTVSFQVAVAMPPRCHAVLAPLEGASLAA
jgi:hypothetical protein